MSSLSIRNSRYVRHRCSLCVTMGLQLIADGMHVIKCYGVSSLANGWYEVLADRMTGFWCMICTVWFQEMNCSSGCSILGLGMRVPREACSVCRVRLQ